MLRLNFETKQNNCLLSNKVHLLLNGWVGIPKKCIRYLIFVGLKNIFKNIKYES